MQDGSRLRSVVEIIGLLGVIASLVFLSLEIRQNTTALRSATIQAVSDQAMAFTLSLATDERLPHLVDRMVREKISKSDLSGEEAIRLDLAVSAGLRRQENLFEQVRAGVLEEADLRSVGLGFYRNVFVREIWARDRALYDPEFADYLDRVLSES